MPGFPDPFFTAPIIYVANDDFIFARFYDRVVFQLLGGIRARGGAYF